MSEEISVTRATHLEQRERVLEAAEYLALVEKLPVFGFRIKHIWALIGGYLLPTLSFFQATLWTQ